MKDENYRKFVTDLQFPSLQSPDLLWVQPKPVFSYVKDGVLIEDASDAPWIEPTRLLLVDDPTKVQVSEWVDGIQYPVQRLMDVECNYCHVQGAVIDTWPEEGADCPYCGNLIVEPHRSWMT